MSIKWQATLPHDVYEITDASSAPLYVGVSMNTVRRLLQHRSKPWFSRAHKVRITTYACLEDAKHVEARRIAELGPAHNIQREHWAASHGPTILPPPIKSREEGIIHG